MYQCLKFFGTFPQMKQLAHPLPGGNKYRNLALQIGGVSKIETIKYAHVSRGTQPRESCAGEDYKS
jgi:hypothetical protein